MQPQALGEDIDVPFINWFLDNVQLGTLVTAAPGAMMETPKWPSMVGPTEDQVKLVAGKVCEREYAGAIRL